METVHSPRVWISYIAGAAHGPNLESPNHANTARSLRITPEAVSTTQTWRKARSEHEVLENVGSRAKSCFPEVSLFLRHILRAKLIQTVRRGRKLSCWSCTRSSSSCALS